MNNPTISSPNDFKVVEFFNSTSFDFTPELGAMFDSRPLFVSSGEKKQYPYHVGHRLAVNLAKAVLLKGAPVVADGNPVGTPLWDDVKLTNLAKSFITELYTESKPIAVSETDRLMTRVAELEKLFKEKNLVVSESVLDKTQISTPKVEVSDIKTYQDKAEVIAELEKRGIAHDKRSNKANLEKLLA